MLFGSVCSGIEAASVAWEALGWRCAYVAEIEPFPAAVLAHRFGAGRPEHMPDPDEPELAPKEQRARRAAIKALDRTKWGDRLHNFGDFTKVDANAHPIEVLVGGTPCQAFSVAGLRQSLADDRGNLTLQFVRLVHASKSLRWAVWENVPGVLSTGDNAFGCFLGGLVGSDAPLSTPDGSRWPDSGMVAGPLGRAAWRILDAQHFGLAQRRRRVFAVFCPAAAGGDCAAVLFERHSLSGNPAPRREAGQTAPTIPSRSSAGGGLGTDFDCDGGLIASTGDISHCLNAGGMGRQDYETETLIAHSLRAEGFDADEDGTGRGTPLVPVCFTAKDHGADASDISPTLRSGAHSGSHANGGVMPAVAFSLELANQGSGGNTGFHGPEMPFRTLSTGGPPGIVGSAVRRLTPLECERLQGFPDNYTAVPYRGKPAADGPRYKALGNSMAVPVMAWIGARIQAAEDGDLGARQWNPPPWVAKFLKGGGGGGGGGGGATFLPSSSAGSANA
jgi:DNA (cytosine-5)-methyltransferase 1